MALTIDEEAEVKAVAAERIKARAAEALQATRDAALTAASDKYIADRKVINDKYVADVAALGA